MGRRSGAPALTRASLLLGTVLLALTACGDNPPPARAVTGTVPPPPPTRFDGNYSGTAFRSFGPEFQCGRQSNPLAMVVAQGRATGALPQQGQATGIVSGDGSLTLRSGLDAAERVAGRISERFEYTARYQTRSCAWDIRLNRV